MSDNLDSSQPYSTVPTLWPDPHPVTLSFLLSYCHVLEMISVRLDSNKHKLSKSLVLLGQHSNPQPSHMWNLLYYLLADRIRWESFKLKEKKMSEWEECDIQKQWRSACREHRPSPTPRIGEFGGSQCTRYIICDTGFITIHICVYAMCITAYKTFGGSMVI